MTVAIKFLTEFDGKALGRAEKGLTKFTKTAVRLAGGLGIALGTASITRYAKASVKAFADDDKAARILSKSLDNLGLHFADTRVKNFIAALEQQFGVLDDYLRPAYQKLLTTTGDYLKSQDLLKTALDLAAFSQESVVSTAADLAKAYAGNTRGLIKYGIGLSKAEIAAMSFEDILAQIAKVSQGAALTAANSYSGSMDRLNVAAANASETIGKGLVQALTEASSAGNFESAISDIDKLAKRTEDFIVFAGRQIQLTLALPSLLDLATGNFDAFKDFLKVYEKISKLDAAMGPQQFGGVYAAKYEKEAAAAAAKKLAADKKAILAKSAAEKKAAAEKKILAKGNALFDLERIGIAAALKMSIDKDTRLRLELLQAIQMGDADLILAKMKELAEWQKNSDMARLGNVKTISEAQLSALNATLLSELSGIDKLNIKESEKDVLRSEAWKRYNDAIKYAGGLAALSTYSQKIQDQELLIQRLASIRDISEAQTAADNIKQAALEKYLATLARIPGTTIPGQPITPTIPLPGAGIGGRGGNAGSGSTFGTSPLDDFITMVEAETERGIRRRAGVGSTNYVALPSGFSSVDEYNKESSGNRGGSGGTIIVNVNAGVVGSEETITNAVQNALNEIARRGNLTTYAGAIAG